MDSPLSQLPHDIRAATTTSIGLQRPLLHHLNADTSWLLQIPKPSASISNTERRSRDDGVNWYTILIDPWFEGSQVDVASWFSEQWHASKSSVSSIADVERRARHVRKLSDRDTRQSDDQSAENDQRTVDVEDNGPTSGPAINLIVISHEFSDHCHKETLLAIDSETPVLATTRAVSLIRSFKHFRHIQEIPLFSGSGQDCRERNLPPIPKWLSISRLVGSYDPLNFHAALLIAFDIDSNRNGVGVESSPEAIIYTPHGIHASSLRHIVDAEPPVRTLALVHGLHVVELSGVQLNLGAHNGLEVQRLLKAKYWVGTHDEVKLAKGVVGRFLSRKVISAEDALLAEKEKRLEDQAEVDDVDDTIEDDQDGPCDDTNFLEVENGGIVVLV